MPSQQQSTKPSDFIVDPNRDGIANALWKANSGALALAGTSPDKFRFNASDAVVRADILNGIIDFPVIFPTTVIQTPTDLVDDLAFGLKNLSMGDLCKIDIFIDQSEDSIKFRTYDEFGVVEETILTWDTDWNNALTIFRFGWEQSHVSLDVLVNAGTEFVNLANHKVRIPNRPLNPFCQAVGADNLDVDFIAVKRALHSSLMLI